MSRKTNKQGKRISRNSHEGNKSAETKFRSGSSLQDGVKIAGSNKSAALMERAQLNTHFTFNKQSGIPFNVGPQRDKYGTPGIMSLYYTPSYGFNDNAASEIQGSINDLYQRVRSYQTASASYDPTDLMMYVLAAEQIYAWVAYLSRGYNATHFSAYETKYSPRVLTKACGFDYDDLNGKRVQLVDHINYIIQTMAGYALPPEMSFAVRQEWLLSNVFRDKDSGNAQLYVINPRTFLRLVETHDSEGVYTYSLEEIMNVKSGPSGNIYQGRGLVPVIINHSQTNSSTSAGYHYASATPFALNLDDIKKVTNMLLEPFVLMHFSEISGDILRAYGPGALRKWAPLTIGEAWMPVYSEKALQMIHNATLIGHLDTTYTKLSENSEGNILLSTPCLYEASDATKNPLWGQLGGNDGYIGYTSSSKLVNLHDSNEISDATLINATQFTNCTSQGTSLLYPETQKHRVITARTEIMEFGIMWIFDYANGHSLDSIIAYSRPFYSVRLNVVHYNPTTSATLVSALNQINVYRNPEINLDGWISSFTDHPIMIQRDMWMNTDGTASNLKVTDWSWLVDLDNWTVLDVDRLTEISNVDLGLSLLVV